MQRRDFIKLAGVFVASAGGAAVLGGCAPPGSSGARRFNFPQGVASGDPQANSVVLWTRVEPLESMSGPVVVQLEVARAKHFASVVLRRLFQVGADSDYCVRVIVQDLEPDTIYYYRFSAADGTHSRTGRTWTAPAADSEQPVRFGVVNCQARSHGFYAGYRALIDQDVGAAPAQRLRFILHLGDFIYETRNDPLQSALDADLNPIPGGLIDASGEARGVAPFPAGGTTASGMEYAAELADYRHLYREYLRDPELLAARARWPFVHIWDDHEFSDDCWQTEANYQDRGPASSTDEPSQPRKVAANQAWFEYLPVDLDTQDEVDADLQHSHAFRFADVGTSPNTAVDADNFVSNADNAAAIATLTIYRRLRFGRMLDLVLTDCRSYRSDHAVPEDLSGNLPLFLASRVALPKQVVDILDAGITADGGNPPATVSVVLPLSNPRRSDPPGTMLGARQKAWWKAVMQRSQARWRVWANSVPLLRMVMDVSRVEALLPDVVLSGDSWDGYPGERRELASFLVDNAVANTVSLAGDVHAHLGGMVMDDYDAAAPVAALPEVVCAALSSVSQFAAVERLSRFAVDSALLGVLRTLITYDSGTATGSDDGMVNNLNNTLLSGVTAGLAAAGSHSASAIAAAADSPNTHLRYVDTDAHGYGIVSVEAAQMTVELHTLASIVDDPATLAPVLRRAARFTIPFAAMGETPTMAAPEIVGEPPFPLNLA